MIPEKRPFSTRPTRHVCLFVFIEKKYLSIKTLAYPRFTVTPVVLWAQTPMGLHRFPWESILIAYCSRQEVVTRLRNHHVIAHAYIIQEKQFFQFSLVNVLEELLQRHTEDYSLANTSQSKTHPKAQSYPILGVGAVKTNVFLCPSDGGPKFFISFS